MSSATVVGTEDATPSWRIAQHRAQAHSARGEFDRALQCYDEAIAACRAAEADGLAELLGERGDVLLERGDTQSALDVFKELLEDHVRDDPAGRARAYRRLGRAWQEKGQPERAIEAYSDADRYLRRVDGQEDERARLLISRGSLHEEHGEFGEARRCYELAKAIAERDGGIELVVLARRHLGSVEHELGALKTAELELTEALEALIRAGGTDKPEMVETMNALGSLLEDQGRTREALERFEEALRIARDIRHLPGQAQSLRRKGSAHATRGEYREALAAYDEAIVLCEHLKDQVELASLHGDRGDVLLDQGRFEDAITAFNMAVKKEQDQRDPLGQAIAFRRLGTAFQAKGDPSHAEEYYSEADAILKTLDDEGERAILYTCRGSLHEEQGKLAQALEWYNAAFIINRRQDQVIGMAICKRHIGSALHEQGDLEAAGRELREALDLLRAERVADSPDLIDALNAYGDVLRDQGRAREARAQFEQAYELARAMAALPAQARCLRLVASTYMAAGDLGEARARLETAIDISRNLNRDGDGPELSELYGELGDVLLARGDVDQAIQSFKRALRLDQEHRDKLGQAVGHRRLGTAYQEKGKFELAEEHFEDATLFLEDSDDEVERALLWLQTGSLHEELGRLKLARDAYTEAFAVYERLSIDLGMARARRHLASVTRRLGDLAAAEEGLRTALAIHNQTGAEDIPEVIRLRCALGGVLTERGEPGDALQVLREAHHAAKEIGNDPARAACLRLMGGAYTRRGEYGDAHDAYKTAVSICSDKGDEVELAELAADLGALHEAQGGDDHLEQAVESYTTALQAARPVPNYALMARALLGLARCHRVAGRDAELCAALDEAAALDERLEEGHVRAELWIEQGRRLEDDDKVGGATERYMQALSYFDRVHDTKAATACRLLLMQTSSRRGDLDEAQRHLLAALAQDTSDPARAWSGVLAQLEEQVGIAAADAFRHGHYAAAVREAFLAAERALRSASSDGDRISEVIKRWITPEGRGLAPWSDSRQLGAFGLLCRGAFDAVRNPLNHDEVDLPLDPVTAFSWIGVAHLIITLAEVPS